MRNAHRRRGEMGRRGDRHDRARGRGGVGLLSGGARPDPRPGDDPRLPGDGTGFRHPADSLDRLRSGHGRLLRGLVGSTVDGRLPGLRHAGQPRRGRPRSQRDPAQHPRRLLVRAVGGLRRHELPRGVLGDRGQRADGGSSGESGRGPRRRRPVRHQQQRRRTVRSHRGHRRVDHPRHLVRLSFRLRGHLRRARAGGHHPRRGEHGIPDLHRHGYPILSPGHVRRRQFSRRLGGPA